jgi:hypothetical protein
MTSIIERLKTNKEAFGLMDAELQEAAEKIGKKEFNHFTGKATWSERGGDSWLITGVYRLRADYQCQHPERRKFANAPSECAWCGVEIEEEKKAGWVESKIISHQGRYSVDFGAGVHSLPYLQELPGMVGFGGIKYQPICKCSAPMGETWRCVPYICETHGPWKPIAVRFWKEPTK